MICHKCGSMILNGESQCLRCGADLDRSPTAVMTERPVRFIVPRTTSRLAVGFFALSLAGLICTGIAGVIVAALGAPTLGGPPGATNLGVLGLGALVTGFIILCIALIFGVLSALRLRESRRLKGRGLAIAGLVLWICGAGLFFAIRTNPWFRPPPIPLQGSIQKVK